MPLVDPIRRSIALKFVYYGPTGVGKTASLKLLEQRLRGGPQGAQACLGRRPGRMLCLDTVDEHTLFFEILSIATMLPAELGGRRDPRLDIRLCLKLFSVPGGDMHRHTRRLLLRGADGIMLVGGKSACVGGKPRDEGSLAELRSNLCAFGLSGDTLPILNQPSPTRGSGESTVIESLLSLLSSSWPTAEQVAKSAGLGGCDLGQLIETLRKSFGVATSPEAPLTRPDAVHWQAPELSDRVRVMP